MRLLVCASLVGLLASPALADQLPGTVSTRATARARLVNTVADVAIGVEAHARTIASTQTALAQASDRLLRFLREHKVERLRTEQVAVMPETETVKGQPDRIVGYGATMQVSFRVPSDQLGVLVSGALENGGNDLRGTLLTPRESELDAERQRLAAEAAKTALAQAEAIAAATGRRLGAIRQIEVEPQAAYPGRMAAMPMARVAASAPAPPVIATEAGEEELTATVMVTVNLVEP